MTRAPDPRRAEKHRLAAEVHARGLSSAPLRVLRTYKPGVLRRCLRRAADRSREATEHKEN